MTAAAVEQALLRQQAYAALARAGKVLPPTVAKVVREDITFMLDTPFLADSRRTAELVREVLALPLLKEVAA